MHFRLDAIRIERAKLTLDATSLPNDREVVAREAKSECVDGTERFECERVDIFANDGLGIVGANVSSIRFTRCTIVIARPGMDDAIVIPSDICRYRT